MFKFLLIFCLYLPFQLALSPAEGVDAASIRIIIPLFFLSWIFEAFRKKKFLLRISAETFLISVFIFLNIFSIFFAKNTDWSLRKILFLLSILPIYFLVANLCDSEKKAEKILKFLVLGGFLAAILGILQFFSQFIFGLDKVYHFWANWVATPFLGRTFSRAVLDNSSWLVGISDRTFLRAISIFPDPHMFSFFLGILAPASLGIFLKNKKPSYLVIFATLLLADFLTFSRGGYLGILAGAIFLAVSFWSSFNFRTKLIAGTASLLLGAVLFFPGPISERFFSSFNAREGSNQGRLVMWEKALDVSFARPLFGVGIGNFPLEVKPTADYREPIYAHNTYLDIASETGWINALVWITLLVFLAFDFWKKGMENRIFFGVATGIVVFAVHSFFETGLYSTVVWTLFLMVAGLAGTKTTDRIKRQV